MQKPQRAAIFSVDSAPNTLTAAAPSEWTRVTNGKSFTVVTDTTGVLQPGLIGTDFTNLIDKFKTTWKWIKILSVTHSFDWNKFQGPASTVTQDTNLHFYFQNNLPVADPAGTAWDWLSSESMAESKGLHYTTKKHGQKWHVTVSPKCMRRGTLWGGQSSDMQTRWFWTSAPWMDMTLPDGASNDLRQLSHYIGAWAMTGLSVGDSIEYRTVVKFVVREPLVV